MIPCNGSHVLTLAHKHGNGVFRCTLANAKKLVDEALKNDSPELARLADELQLETRAVRPMAWLTRALANVRDLKEQPTALRMALYGPGPKQRDAEDPRPAAVVTAEMQSELVLFAYHHQLKLESLSNSDALDAEMAQTAWDTLSFLAPARERLTAGVRFVPDYLSDGYDQLRVIRQDKWKDDAREERVISQYFCPFLSEWGSGKWDVEKVQDV